MVEWVESTRVSLSDTPVDVAVRVKSGLLVKQVPRGEKIGVLLNTVPHLRKIEYIMHRFKTFYCGHTFLAIGPFLTRMICL